ncbi:hypothetical protein MATL_G00224340 [Megalops atlanticus]|uniref:SH3 domain-containing protein n=1 Tax=Megalops atlanticus TaxID=7932 RepID=A0A9D3T361_MEGAT|nr:hypothetical protein MATL_G00224340 [Megalops atlanticus]
MAEARLEEEEESRELREPAVLRTRRQSNPATDRSERNKPEQRASNQGPLSSLRAAIKRTSARSSSQSDHRDRRRPEITIVSAEPLASNAWFQGASGGFPPSLSPSQPIWGGSIPASAQPPPSYDQVIKEKTQEQIVLPTAPPRRSTPTNTTTTIATQTDFLANADTADPECTAPPETTEKAKSVVKRALKPPRPAVPAKPKPAPSAAAAAPDVPLLSPGETPAVPTETDTDIKHQTPEAQICHPDPSSEAVSTTSSPATEPCDPCPVSVGVSSDSAEPDSVSFPKKRPVPRPRSKQNVQSVSRDVKVQTLVRIKEEGDCPQPAPTSGEVLFGKYLQEILDVFSADDQSHQSDPSECSEPNDPCDPCDPCDPSDPSDQSDTSDQSEEDDSMSASFNQRNIKAKIQAFEQQASVDAGDGEPAKKPEPRPRGQLPKPPPVAAKPSLVRRPSCTWQENPETVPSAENGHKAVTSPPTPVPRPQLPRSSSEAEIREPPLIPPEKVAVLPPPRPSIASRAKAFAAQEEESTISKPLPSIPAKPIADLANLINQNPPSAPAVTSMENGSVDRPVNKPPVKPQRTVTAATNRPPVTRKPTMIRVPSKVDKMFEESPDTPPPLPAQKPVGGVALPVARKPSLVSRPTFPPPEQMRSAPTPTAQPPSNSEGFGASMPEPSLPPRPVGGKVLPPRPPPVKGAPGRPPAPRNNSSHTRPAVVLPKRSKSHQGTRKGPVLPPRPNPGHPLYNKYTLGIPHGIAQFDYNGTNTAELSFQKNEVLVLLEQIDNNTFECQVGDTKGPVNKSYLKVITPLSSAPSRSPSLPPRPGQARKGSSGLQVQALHDFTPEGSEELALRAGDLVCMVERVDDEWYSGTCRGCTGIFPVSYVRVLSSIPAPPSAKKAPPAAAVSGPRVVARFDFEGEHSDELSFSEGDVIKLKEYVGEDWARGQINGYIGIFPLNFVDIVEDLPPPPPAQQAVPTKTALPGMVSTHQNHMSSVPSQPDQPEEEWCRALYDFTAQTDEDLSFQQGALILIKDRVDSEWCRGRLEDREGYFPAAFVEPCAVPSSESVQEEGGGRARVLYDFVSDSEEELSMKVGDIITSLESIDDDWFLGELKGKRGLVPKNYVQVLQEP